MSFMQKSQESTLFSNNISTSTNSHHYNFNNLPSFSARSPSSASNPINNTSDITINQQPREKLPFGSYKFQPVDDDIIKAAYPFSSHFQQRLTSINSRKPSTVKDTNLFRKISKNSIFKSSLDDNPKEKIAEESETNIGIELFTFIKSLFMLLYLIGEKTVIWALFGLNYGFSIIERWFRRIPNPEWNKIEYNNDDKVDDSLVFIDEDSMAAESTAQMIKLNSSGIFGTPIIDENEHLNKRLQKVKAQGNTQLKTNTALEVPEKKTHYGTHFFQDNSTAINLESAFMTSVADREMKPVDLKEQMYSKLDSIKSSLGTLYKLEKPKTNIKPSFTRSSSRFADLEWLKDDNEDYITNLEFTRLFKEYQKIFHERSKVQELMEIKKLKEEGLAIKPLDVLKIKEVENIWEEVPPGVIISKFRIDITARDFLTLKDCKWLNDNIIDFYLSMVAESVNGYDCKEHQQKVHIFTTHFFTTLKSKGYTGVKRWAKRAKVDVSKLKYLIVPVNFNQSHWALAVVDNVLKKFIYIDSLNGTGRDVLMKLMDYMSQETERIYGKGMNGNDYTLYEMNSEAVGPKQENSFDCGVFTCTGAACIANGMPLSYTQGDMPMLRRKMGYEIWKGRLED